MRSKTPTIHCDGDDGFCDEWAVDSYAINASSLNGIPVTRSHRAPGWISTDDDEDLCPEHAPAKEN